jgi:hypothetical protein
MTTLLNYPQLSGCITLVLIPLIGIIGVLLAKNKEREFALIASILTLLESIRV